MDNAITAVILYNNDADNIKPLLVAMVMLIIFVSASNKKLITIIAICSLTEFAINYFIKDIALFYSANMVSTMFASYSAAYLVKSDARRVYAIIMFIQAILCAILVFDWGYNSNIALQFAHATYNESIHYVIIIIGIVESDSFLFRLCNSSRVVCPGHRDWGVGNKKS